MTSPPQKYKTTSTSATTADVEDIVLHKTSTTRTVVRSSLVRQTNKPKEGVRFHVVHQRKSKKQEWEDCATFRKSSMKAGEEIKQEFTSAMTRRLFEILDHLYNDYREYTGGQGSENLVTVSKDQVVIAGDNLTSVIQQIVDKGLTEQAWEEIAAQDSELLSNLALAEIQRDRQQTLDKFRFGIEQKKGEQEFWDEFFKTNTWVFGYGLEYKFLETIEDQPNYGGASFTGKGTQRGDTLTASAGDVRFTVLVEIKAPSTDLLEKDHYRRGSYSASKELSGAIAQVQANCATWSQQGSKTDQSRDQLEVEDIYTVEPKGILIIGHTSQLNQKIDKKLTAEGESGREPRDRRQSFERLRRSLINPTILTFDELYERASFIVNNSEKTPSFDK